MIRALYTAASGMMVEQKRLDIASKNMYYGRLPGFKRFNMLRGSMKQEDPSFDTDIQTHFIGEFIDPSAGALRSTNNNMDLALEGDGFFSVQSGGGVAYTRNGRFRKMATGEVVDSNGSRLLGETGIIVIPSTATIDSQIEVDREGNFSVDGQFIDKLRIRQFPGYRGIQAAGGAIFYPTGAVQPVETNASVHQGMLEDPNVSVVAEMTQVLEAVRAFEAYQKVVQTVMDDLTGESVTRIGRVA